MAVSRRGSPCGGWVGRNRCRRVGHGILDTNGSVPGSDTVSTAPAACRRLVRTVALPTRRPATSSDRDPTWHLGCPSQVAGPVTGPLEMRCQQSTARRALSSTQPTARRARSTTNRGRPPPARPPSYAAIATAANRRRRSPSAGSACHCRASSAASFQRSASVGSGSSVTERAEIRIVSSDRPLPDRLRSIHALATGDNNAAATFHRPRRLPRVRPTRPVPRAGTDHSGSATASMIAGLRGNQDLGTATGLDPCPEARPRRPSTPVIHRRCLPPPAGEPAGDRPHRSSAGSIRPDVTSGIPTPSDRSLHERHQPVVLLPESGGGRGHGPRVGPCNSTEGTPAAAASKTPSPHSALPAGPPVRRIDPVPRRPTSGSPIPALLRPRRTPGPRRRRIRPGRPRPRPGRRAAQPSPGRTRIPCDQDRSRQHQLHPAPLPDQVQREQQEQRRPVGVGPRGSPRSAPSSRPARPWPAASLP